MFGALPLEKQDLLVHKSVHDNDHVHQIEAK